MAATRPMMVHASDMAAAVAGRGADIARPSRVRREGGGEDTTGPRGAW